MTRTIDGREMAPPAPLEATLEALDTLAAGEELVLLVYCHPRPLLDILRRDGVAWSEEIRQDGTHAIRMRRG